jgi:NarL family two-component system response regulator LiaR
MPEPITILLVDDHNMVRMGLKAYFSTIADLQVIGEASSGEQAIELTKKLAPDIVLMDLIMPGMDGVEATRKIKQTSPHTQVIVVTSFHEDEHVFPAIRAGALSYVLKDIDPDELADAIRKAHTGEATLDPKVGARIIKEIQGARQEDINPFTELTDRELEVLRLIAAGKNNHDIAEVLVISEKTVKSHISNILGKLHLADRTQAAVFAWQEGIIRRHQQE